MNLNNASNVNTIIGNKLLYTFTSSVSNSISFNLAGGDMLQGASVGSPVLNESTNMNITFSSNENVSKYCTYDIVWVWDETNNTNNQYVKSAGAINEFTITGTDGTNNILETQFNSYGEETLLYSGYLVSASSNIVLQPWDFYIKFYNLNINQDNHENANYAGKIKIENVDCNLGTATEANNRVIALSANYTYNNPDSFANTILADNQGTIIIEEKPTPTFSSQAATNEGMFATDDDYTAITGKKSYYFRGAVNNNWVHFAGFYWRIIRINGDGSIRMIYSGTTAPTSSTSVTMTGSGTYISMQWFNNSYNQAEYVGIRYSLGSGHGTGTPSTILGADSNPSSGTLNYWYEHNILENLYEEKINTNQIMCSDRTAYANSQGTTIETGTGSNYQIFGANVRNSSNQPSFICSEDNDKFTTQSSMIGNKSLKYPIALITLDEAKMAGLNGSDNNSNYLYTSYKYWTSSPYGFFSGSFAEYIIHSSGYLYYESGISGTYGMASTIGVRPVISLKGDLTVTGNGTWQTPYEVS